MADQVYRLSAILDVEDHSSSGISEFNTGIESAEDRVNRLDGMTAVVDLELRDDEFHRDVDEIERRMDALTRDPKVLTITADGRGAEETVDRIEQRLDQAVSRERTFMIGADAREAERTLGGFEQWVQGVAQRISQMNPSLNIGANTSSADQSVSGLESRVQGTVGRISQMSPTLKIGADDSQALTTVRNFGASVEETARRIDTTRPTLRTEADTSRMDADLNRSQSLLNSIFNRRYTLDVDTAAARALPTLMGNLQVAMSRFQVIGAIIGSSVLPLLQTGFAGLISAASAAGAGIFGLAQGAGSAAAGFGALAAALAVGRAGLAAYAGVVRDAVKMSQDGAFASTQWAHASDVFNARLGVLQGGFQALRTELAGQTLPTLTAFVNTGIELLPRLGVHANNLVTSVNSVALSFLRAATDARQLSIIDSLMSNAVRSTGILAAIAGNATLALVNVFAAAIPHGNRLGLILNDLIQRFRLFTTSTQGQAALDRFFATAANAAIGFSRAVADVAVGLYRIGAALSASGLTGALTSGIANAAARFRDFAAAGTSGRAAIEAFGQRATPILQAAGRAAMAIVTEFFRVADAVSKVRDSTTGLPLLASILDSIGRAARPIGDLLIQSFAALGPVLPPLIQNVAEFLRVIAAITPITVAVLSGVNALLGAFNSLPLGMREGIAQAVALTVAFNSLIGVGMAVVRFFSPLGAAIRMARTEGTLLNSALAPIGRAIMAIAGPIGTVVAAIGRFVAQRVIIAGLAAVFGSLSAPVLIAVGAIAALAAGVLYAYRNFTTFRNIVNTVGSTIRSAFTGAVSAVGSLLSSLPARASAAWNTIRSGAVSAFNSLRSGASSAVQGVIGFFQSLPGRITGFFRAIPGAAQAAWSALRSGASSAISAVIAAFASLPGRATAFLSTLARAAGTAVGHIVVFFRDLPTRLGEIWNSVKSGAQVAWDAIVAFVATIPGRLAAVWESIKAGASAAWEFIKSTGQAALDAVVSFIVSLPGRAASAWESIKSAASTAWEFIKSTGQAAIDAVVSFVVSLPGRAASAWSSIQAAASAAWEAIKSTGQAAIDAVVSFILNIPSNAASAWSSLVSGAQSAWSSIVSFFQNLPSTIGGLFQAAADAAISAAQWLADGVLAAFSWLGDQLSSVTSYIKSTIIDPFMEAYNAVVGGSIVPDLVREVDDWVRRVPRNTDEALRDLPDRMGKHFEESARRAKGHLKSMQGDLDQLGRAQAAPGTATGAAVSAAMSPAQGSQPGSPPVPPGAVSQGAGQAPGQAPGQPPANPPAPVQVGGSTDPNSTDPVSLLQQIANGMNVSRGQGGQAAQAAQAPPTAPTSGGSRVGINAAEFASTAKEADTQLGNLSNSAERHGRETARRLNTHFADIRRTGDREFRQLSRDADQHSTALRRDVDRNATGSQQAVTQQSELMRRNAGQAHTALNREATLQQTLLTANTTTQQTVARNNAVALTESMRGEVSRRQQQLQLLGTSEQTKLQANTTTQQNLARDNAVRATETMRATNTTALTNLQTAGTQQMTTLQTNATAQMTSMQQNGTTQMTTLQQNGTSQSNQLQKNVTTYMTAARDNTISTLTSAQQTGSQQLESLRANGTSAMQAADSEWRTPVGNAASGIQNYLNDMLFGMAAVIEAAKLPLTAPVQFTPRLTGGGGSSGGGGRKFAQGGIVGSRFASGGFASEFEQNAAESPWRGAPGAMQAEDSSWVRPGFYGGGQASQQAPSASTAGSTAGSIPISFGLAFERGGESYDGDAMDWAMLRDFVARGQVGWDDGTGGVAPPGQSYLHWWGEGESAQSTEYYIVDGREDNLPILERAAASLGRELVPAHSGEEGGQNFQPRGMPRVPTYMDPRRFEDGGIALRAFAHGATAWEDLWTPRTAEIARETEAATGATPNTYFGHPDGYEYRESYSIDFWSGQRGSALPIDVGDQVLSYILSNFYDELTYWIWNYQDSFDGSMAGEESHWDHPHVTMMGPEGMLNSIGAFGAGPNLRGLIEENMPAVQEFGSSVPEMVATEIGKATREGIEQELLKYSGPGRAGTMFSGGGDVASNMALGEEMAANMGWTGAQWEALRELWNYESGWDHLADNPESDAFGIPQGMMGPGGHTPPEGYFTDPAVQIDWGLGYIAQRYGDPITALDTFYSQGSYTSGGLAVKPQVASVAENGPEFFMPLHDPESARRFMDFVENLGTARADRRGGAEGMREARGDARGRPHRGGIGDPWDTNFRGRDRGGGGQYGAFFGSDSEDEEAPHARGRTPEAAYGRLMRQGLPAPASATSSAVPVTNPPDQVRKAGEGVEAAKQTAASTKALQQGTPMQETSVDLERQTATGTNQIVKGTQLANTTNQNTARGADASQNTAGSVQQLVNGTPLQSQTATGATQTAANTAQIAQGISQLPQQIAQATGGATAGGASAGGGMATAGGVTAGPGQTATYSSRNTTVDQYTDIQNTGKTQGGGTINIGGQSYSSGSGGGSGRLSSDPISQSVRASGSNQYVNANMSGGSTISGSNSGTNTQTYGVDEPNRKVNVQLTSNDQGQSTSNSYGGAGGGAGGSGSGGGGSRLSGGATGGTSGLNAAAPAGMSATSTVDTQAQQEAEARREALRLQREREAAFKAQLEALQRDRDLMMRDRERAMEESRALRDDLTRALRDTAREIADAVREPTRLDDRSVDQFGNKVKEGIEGAPNSPKFQKKHDTHMRRETTKTNWGGN